MKKALFVATIDSHIKAFHLPYLKLLKDMGYEVHVATNGDESFSNCDVKHKICVERSPFKINNLKAIKQLKKIIDEERFDLIHCHTPMGAVVTRLAAIKARKKFNTRVIYTCHGFHFYKGSSILCWVLFYPIEKILAKYNDILITINREDFELAQKKFKNRCKNIYYMPGIGIDNKKFKYDISSKEKKDIIKSLNLSENDFIIIYPARLCPDKNQLLLLDFMKKLKYENVKLLLPGNDEYNGFYQKYVKKNNIKNVFFLGQRDDIPSLLKISHLLVASSIREGFGINIVEALSCNVPVIAVENRGHKEIVQDGVNGFIVKNDVEDLINKFEYIFNNKEIYKNLKMNCCKSVEKYFLENSLKFMKKIYKL